MRTKKIIGQCGVDAGCLMVGDPCYFIGAKAEEKAINREYKNWPEFCETHFPYNFDATKGEVPMQVKHQIKNSLGVVVNTVHGDGVYDVEGVYEGKTLVEIRIKLK